MKPAGNGHRTRALAVLACLGLAAGTCGSLATAFANASMPARGQLAVVARACKPPPYPSVGYFISITVTRTTCATGSKFVLAFYRCRTKSGPAGKCRSTVLGFRCSETRNSIPTEIDARDTCARGHEKVVSVWQQDIS